MEPAAKTVKLTVKNVELEPSLFASSEDPNSASIMAYVRFGKRFKPVSGDPYTETGTQAYKVSLRIIKRRWTVVICLSKLVSSFGRLTTIQKA